MAEEAEGEEVEEEAEAAPSPFGEEAVGLVPSPLVSDEVDDEASVAIRRQSLSEGV